MQYDASGPTSQRTADLSETHQAIIMTQTRSGKQSDDDNPADGGCCIAS